MCVTASTTHLPFHVTVTGNKSTLIDAKQAQTKIESCAPRSHDSTDISVIMEGASNTFCIANVWLDDLSLILDTRT